jgi:hypothetical protein
MDKILVRLKIPHHTLEGANFGDILLLEAGLLVQISDQNLVGLIHARSKKF